MADSQFKAKLYDMEFPFRRKKKKRAEEIRDLIIEIMDEIELESRRNKPNIFGISFDRTKGVNFDYWAFDEILVQLDAGSGGNGLKKPLHQIRVITWRHGANDLVKVIRGACAGNNSLRFHRLFVFQINSRSKGFRLNSGIYRR